MIETGLSSEWSSVFYLANQWYRLQKVRFVSDAFRLCKSGNAYPTEADAEMGERQTPCAQMKNVPSEISQTMLAGRRGFRFNWLEPHVSTLNVCNLLILRNKFNWLKLVDQAIEAVFSILQTSGFGYKKCASSAMLSSWVSRGMPVQPKLVLRQERVNQCVKMTKILPEISLALLDGRHGFCFNWLEPQVSTMNFCNLLFLQDKFNWLKMGDQVNGVVFSFRKPVVWLLKMCFVSNAILLSKLRNAMRVSKESCIWNYTSHAC